MSEPSTPAASTSSGDLADVARWLADCGYPFDWSNENAPPVALRSAIEDEWIGRDGDTTPEWAAIIRANVAEEGRWICYHDSLSGIDQAPDGPDKVWLCHTCGGLFHSLTDASGFGYYVPAEGQQTSRGAGRSDQ